MTHLLTVLADPGMQRVLLALGSLLITGLALSAWLLPPDRDPFPPCPCEHCDPYADALALANEDRPGVLDLIPLIDLHVDSLPDDMRMERDR